jgi:hypothetical protein
LSILLEIPQLSVVGLASTLSPEFVNEKSYFLLNDYDLVICDYDLTRRPILYYYDICKTTSNFNIK